MAKKILIAGAGHGGLAVAARLAKTGMDVTVLEKNSMDALGYDWTDIFAPSSLAAADIPMPPKEQYTYKENMTFYSPDMQTPLRQNVAPDQLEIKMERRDLYALLIQNAEQYSVTITYDCTVTGPILVGNRVVGLQTDAGDLYADLVIDAAGLHSPVRENLPAMCLVENTVGPFERFFVYRGFYNRIAPIPQDNYQVFLLPQGKCGIGWVASEEAYTDLLIGRFSPIDEAELQDSSAYMRSVVPTLGDELLRGGSFVEIPVRYPLSVMVCDGYAAIGDSAFMTVPIIGSGIANSMKAARILANTILRDQQGAFSATSLWPYQVAYYKQLGNSFAALACVKNLLAKLEAQDLDYIFKMGILTADDLTIGADSTSISSIIKMKPRDLLDKGNGLVHNPALLKKLLPTFVQFGKVTALTAAMPRQYSYQTVSRWAKQYRDACRIQG